MADLCFEEVVLNVVAPCPLCMDVSGVAERMEERECLFLGSPDALCKPSVGREYKTLKREMGGCREGNCYLPKRDGSFSRSQGGPRKGCLSKNVPWKWSSLGTDGLLFQVEQVTQIRSLPSLLKTTCHGGEFIQQEGGRGSFSH